MPGAGQPMAAPDAAPVQRNLTRLTFGPGLQADPAFSPDGRFLAFSADRDGNVDVYVQPLSGGDPVRVTKSPAADTQPSWSPDGASIAFRSERDGGGIFVAPAFGGAERRVVGEGSHPWWTPDGGELQYLIEPFGNASRVVRAVSVTGGAPRNPFPAVQAQGPWVWIGPAPGGRTSFLGTVEQGRGFYTVSDAGVVQSDLAAVRESLPNVYGGQASIFAEARFQWNADGSALLLQTRSADGIRNLWRVSVDPATLAWTRIDRLTTGSGSFVGGTYAPGGTRLAFSIQEESDQLWEYTVAGTALSNGRALSEHGASVLGADVSQDGHTLMFQLLRPGGPPSPPFWVSVRGQPASELPGVQGLPWVRLSPDGSRFAYLKLRAHSGGGFGAALATRGFDGADRQISPWEGMFRSPSDWSPDGRFLLTGGPELRAWPVEASPERDESRIVLTPQEGNLWGGRYSPDGRWIAFVNSQRPSAPDRCAVGVVAADGPLDRQWISVAPDRTCADQPRWNRDGTALFFLGNEGAYLQVWRVPFDTNRGEPAGPAGRLSAFESPAFKLSQSLSRASWGVADPKVYLTMTSTSGSVWMLDNVDR
jgi:Tol biopolymer transport system component